MTPKAYRKIIIDKYLEMTKESHWEISDENFNMFADIAKFTGSGKTVLDNWELYLKRNKERSVKGFTEWYIDEVLKDDYKQTRKNESNPFNKMKQIWGN